MRKKAAAEVGRVMTQEAGRERVTTASRKMIGARKASGARRVARKASGARRVSKGRRNLPRQDFRQVIATKRARKDTPRKVTARSKRAP
jgi:hypothetical protein